MIPANDLIIMFPAYAGGKFISNCLCLSKQFVPASVLFDLRKTNDYDYRLSFVITSLPSKNEMSNWLKFEFGEHDRNGNFYKLAKEMNLRCIRVSHGFDASLLGMWSPCSILKLIKYEKFRHLAYSLKRTNRDYVDEDNEARYNFVKGSNWPQYVEFSAVGFDTRKLKLDRSIKSDIDQFYPLGSTSIETHLFDQSTIFDKEMFLSEMQKTYIALGLDDFDETITSIFYTKYATLHNIRS